MIEENQNSTERLNDQPSTGNEASVAERIARALGPRPALTDEDVVGDEPSPEPFASVPERYEPAAYEPPSTSRCSEPEPDPRPEPAQPEARGCGESSRRRVSSTSASRAPSAC